MSHIIFTCVSLTSGTVPGTKLSRTVGVIKKLDVIVWYIRNQLSDFSTQVRGASVSRNQIYSLVPTSMYLR